MKLLESLRKRWLAAVAMAVAATAIGAVFGSPHTGRAATQAAPTNTATPTISGPAQEGSKLTASQGTWTGTDSTTKFTYAWSRCDRNGDNCAAIAGATTQDYTVQSADVGHTLRVTVTATNSDNTSGQATSVPTAVVTAAAAATGCPAGTGTIQIADLAPPARLLIDSEAITPGTVTRSTSTIQLHFRVTACGGRPVQGAAAYGTPVPFNQFTTGTATTGADGMATMTLNRMSGFPADRRQQLLTIFARASKPGEQIVGGVSTRLLTAYHVRLG
jgi:hypothetical protein